MGTTTFSGPIKAGTIRETTGTTLGANVVNTGFVVMAQSAKIDITGASHLNQVIGTIPANSQITDVILNVTTVNNDTNAATVSVGTTDDGDAFIASANVKALATTRGTLDTEATNIGTTDIQVLADFTGTDGDGTTGNATVTVMYMQNNSIADAGDVPA
tara:strand:+ start:183 stop:659 length:477 start_codon:yes stop_codon:yes gene_type:complete